MKTVYIESELINHPRTQQILSKLPKNKLIIECEHYGNVFNPKNQNFRLQKSEPALIIAKKSNARVLKTPEGFGIGGQHNYYFSHMLNCIYDCRYCFLQGMYASAHHVLFINYEDFWDDIEKTIKQHAEPCYFFSGYDGDSVAYENVSQFIESFYSCFQKNANAFFELRTKSANINTLLKLKPLANVIVAFSFTPQFISEQIEHNIPAYHKRIKAVKQLADQGWNIGLRFDPLIYTPDYRQHYQTLIEDLFNAIGDGSLHSVSLGPLRFPQDFYQKLIDLYPEEKLLGAPLTKQKGLYAYPKSIESEMSDWLLEVLSHHTTDKQCFRCHSL